MTCQVLFLFMRHSFCGFVVYQFKESHSGRILFSCSRDVWAPSPAGRLFLHVDGGIHSFQEKGEL